MHPCCGGFVLLPLLVVSFLGLIRLLSQAPSAWWKPNSGCQKLKWDGSVVCGDINPSVGVIAKTGVEAMDIDYMVDLKEARNKIQRQICLRGNLSPMYLLEMSYDKLVEHCCQIIHAGETPFVLSTGCLVARDTPKENIDAMVVASK